MVSSYRDVFTDYLLPDSVKDSKIVVPAFPDRIDNDLTMVDSNLPDFPILSFNLDFSFEISSVLPLNLSDFTGIISVSRSEFNGSQFFKQLITCACLISMESIIEKKMGLTYHYHNSIFIPIQIRTRSYFYHIFISEDLPLSLIGKKGIFKYRLTTSKLAIPGVDFLNLINQEKINTLLYFGCSLCVQNQKISFDTP
ncbi:TPA_asm: hypothetical protein [Triaenorhabdovirus 2]|nr:TPA_asm: hypothetical protein [Triaenorhabdovirus 2]